ncbi:MAG TPA: hypothetical protein VN695_06045 [Streptosporangiaceae bacterium]|nr:hypothetical protein [Streptosporangiaceae bacterium]
MVRRSALATVLGGLAAGSLAFSSGVAAASAPVKARAAVHHTYTFILDIKHGSYASEQTLDGATQHENDNFGGQSFVGGVAIPVKPTAFKILKPATRFSMWPDEKGTPQWRTYGTGGTNCTAHLTNNDPDIPPPILKGSAAKGAKTLTFKIQLGASIIVKDARGHHPSAPCDSVFPDGTKAFASAEQKYMPEMVTAKLTVSLKKIRALEAGKEIVIDVTAHSDALKLPPENCSISSLKCSQSTSWRGTLTIRRTR